MLTIRTRDDAAQALLEMASWWSGLEGPTDNGLANLLIGLELSLERPKWALALLNLAGHKSDSIHAREIKEMVARYPIEVEAASGCESHDSPSGVAVAET